MNKIKIYFVKYLNDQLNQRYIFFLHNTADVENILEENEKKKDSTLLTHGNKFRYKAGPSLHCNHFPRS